MLGNRGVPLETKLPNLEQLSQLRLPWMMLGCLQLLCSLTVLLAFCFSIVPAWFLGKLLVNYKAFGTFKALGTDVPILWLWFPIVIPAWMMSLSLITVLMKWVMIGKYKEGRVVVCSLYYVRWWLVDRFLAVWEFWVGCYFLDTPIIKVFYFLMGANIHRTVSIEAFVREFDLVTVDKGSSLSYRLHCRKYGSWGGHSDGDGDDGPSLRFRSIHIEHHCMIKGFVSPGSRIGCKSIVERLYMN